MGEIQKENKELKNTIEFVDKYLNYNIINHLQNITNTYCHNKKINNYPLVVRHSHGCFSRYKSEKRLINIIEQIKKFVHNAKQNGQFKMYQTRGFCEYKLLSKYCKQNNIEHSIIINDKIKTNKLLSITQYTYNNYSEDDLMKSVFVNEKVPTIYIKVKNTCKIVIEDIEELD